MRDDAVLRHALPLGRGLGRPNTGCVADKVVDEEQDLIPGVLLRRRWMKNKTWYRVCCWQGDGWSDWSRCGCRWAMVSPCRPPSQWRDGLHQWTPRTPCWGSQSLDSPPRMNYIHTSQSVHTDIHTSQSVSQLTNKVSTVSKYNWYNSFYLHTCS